MDDETHNIGELAKRAMAAAVLPAQSTKGLTGSVEHKRAFFEMFRRWEVLFKRKDTGDVQADKWLIAEYYDSLGHLSPDGMQALTRMLKENCTFFPSIRECLDLMRPKDRYDWGHPFLGAGGSTPAHLLAGQPNVRVIGHARYAHLTDQSHEPAD